MQKVFIICIIIFCQEYATFGQAGDLFKKLLRKYETPAMDISLAIDTMTSDLPWRVYPDRDSVPVFSGPGLMTVIDTAYFMEEYMVWDETDEALRLVYNADTGNSFIGERFNEGIREKGWVKKDQLILWPRVLEYNGITVLAYTNKSVPPFSYFDGRHSEAIEVNENEVKLFKLLKISGTDYLLSITDQVNRELTKSKVFWTRSGDLHLLFDRNAFIPDWSNISNGRVCYSYPDLESALGEMHTAAIDSVTGINSFLGFIDTDTLQDNIYLSKSILDRSDRKAILNNNYNDFQHVQLLDKSQFLIIKEFIEVFFNNILNKEGFEEEVSDFFRRYGISDKDINTFTIKELIEKACKIRLSVGQERDVVRAGEMSDNNKRIFLGAYANLLDLFSSEQMIDPYRFKSDITYYWLPDKWFLPDRLSGIKLYTNGAPGKKKRKNYNEFDLIYIDNSADSDEKTYEQLQAEISRFDKTFAQIQKKAESNAGTGHLMYYYDAVHPIMDKEYGTLENIVIAMRNGSTSKPTPARDKMKLENELLIDEINTVSEKFTIYFIVSDYLYNEELYERSYLFNEFPQRIQALVAQQAEVKIIFYVYEKKTNINEFQSTLNDFINQMKKEGSTIQYEIYKIR